MATNISTMQDPSKNRKKKLVVRSRPTPVPVSVPVPGTLSADILVEAAVPVLEVIAIVVDIGRNLAPENISPPPPLAPPPLDVAAIPVVGLFLAPSFVDARLQTSADKLLQHELVVVVLDDSPATLLSNAAAAVPCGPDS